MGAAERFMSREEIRKLCRTPQRKRQINFLRKNGIRHYLDDHDWPVVLWSEVEGIMGARAEKPRTWQPNKAA